jgi:hypothetical protein
MQPLNPNDAHTVVSGAIHFDLTGYLLRLNRGGTRLPFAVKTLRNSVNFGGPLAHVCFGFCENDLQ